MRAIDRTMPLLPKLASSLLLGALLGACGSSAGPSATGGAGGLSSTASAGHGGAGHGGSTGSGAAGPTTLAGALVMGEHFSCAVVPGGVVRCWGSGNSGQLGNGSTADIGAKPGDMPPPDVALGGPVTALFAGARANHVCALRADGALTCWGHNSHGQLGVGDSADVGDGPGEMPPPLVATGGAVVSLSAGTFHTCALLASGAVRCWGANDDAQLGISFVDSKQDIGDEPGEMPPADLLLGGAALALAAGYRHTCALVGSGAVRCWGTNDRGQLGYGDTLDVGDDPGEMPPKDVNVGGAVTQLSAGADFNCALLDTGAVRCWGDNASGQVGAGSSAPFIGGAAGDMPRPDIDLGGPVTRVATGAKHACALMASGAVRCWGDNTVGQLGQGNQESRGGKPGDMPPPDVALGGKAVHLVAAGQRTCAVMDTGSLRCWGDNGGGALGYGDTAVRGDEPGEMPTPDVPIGGSIGPLPGG